MTFFSKLKQTFPKDLTDRILAAGVLLRCRSESKVYLTPGSANRGCWPDPNTQFDPMEELLPGITQEVHSLFFPDGVVPTGRLSVFWFTKGPNTAIPPHVDLCRKCAINTDLLGGDGVITRFFRRDETVTPRKPSYHLSEVEPIGEFTQRGGDVWLIDTTVIHALDSAILQERDVAILSYGWYDPSPEFSVSAIGSKLRVDSV